MDGDDGGVSQPWSNWLDQHGRALLLFARQWVPGRADAEDVVQDAFIRFWRSRAIAKDHVAYLFACVKHRALDWQRERQRQSRRERSAARPETEPLFEGVVELDERRSAISAALGKLPDEQREVLVLKIWGALSFPQIGEALGIPANTAASRYRYGLGKLREQLVEESVP
jgi:RNA polymerase sigma-70 factor (ECF subfamily)